MDATGSRRKGPSIQQNTVNLEADQLADLADRHHQPTPDDDYGTGIDWTQLTTASRDTLNDIVVPLLQDRTQSQIAAELGITRGRVAQRLRHLRHELEQLKAAATLEHAEASTIPR